MDKKRTLTRAKEDGEYEMAVGNILIKGEPCDNLNCKVCNQEDPPSCRICDDLDPS